MNGDRRRFVQPDDEQNPDSSSSANPTPSDQPPTRGPRLGLGVQARARPGQALTRAPQTGSQNDSGANGSGQTGSLTGATGGANTSIFGESPFPNSEDLVPSIDLPQGGGAISAIGEKFEAVAFTGSGGTSIPFPSSPARDLTPELSIGYSTGAGNGPYGLGWSLSVPSITRKTDKGLPTYDDDADTFIVAGAEDLVPLLEQQGNDWVAKVHQENGFQVYAYRPRVEAAFSRIERWVDLNTGDTYWRTWSRNNVQSYFGRSPASRIADPADPRRVMTWLLDEVRDDRGNITQFEYKQEDLDNVNSNAPEEHDRLAVVSTQAQRYLKRIRYGNGAPNVANTFRFEILFDYGEHDEHGTEVTTWPARPDTFSAFRSGFDIRTRRLCRRILMIHHFPELPVDPYLVGALELTYDEDPALTLLRKAVWRGYVYDSNSQTYTSLSMPAMTFDYQAAVIDETIHRVERDQLDGVPGGFNGGIQLVDLDGEGLSGILYSRGGHWQYKRSEGGGQFGPPVALPQLPSLGRTTPRLMDLDGDGQRSVVSLGGTAPGSFERTFDPCSSAAPKFEPHQAFRSLPNINFDAPNVQLIDLNGDGFADVLVAEGSRFTWYPSLGREGFGEPRVVQQSRNEHAGPQMIWSDPRQAIYFSDMTGDGLSDIVRVRNGETVYWPNVGYGRFGRQIVMRGSPSFDRPDVFHTRRLRIGDIDGTGTTDILYIGAKGTAIYRNLSGNAFATKTVLTGIPQLDTMAYVELADILGKGTAALVWTTDAPSQMGTHVRYVDLLAAGKPYLLIGVQNGIGLETKVRYAPSTKYYLEDRAAGRPWKTRLPFPVHVIERTEIRDHITGHTFVQTYKYHHGYFDGAEREFRGFGMVEVEDTESFDTYNDPELFPSGHEIVDEALHVPPVVTKTWFHTGVYLGDDSLSRCYADEYYSDKTNDHPNGIAVDLADTLLPDGLTPIEKREAARALRGRALRVEVFSRDGSDQEQHPYTVAETNFSVRLLQPLAGQRYAAFFVHDHESLSYHYERNPADPRVSQTAVLEVDEFGTPRKTVTVAYPRISAPDLPQEQETTSIVYSETDAAHNPDALDAYRLGVPIETRGYEVTGLPGDPTNPHSFDTLATHIAATTEIPYEADPDNSPQRRLLARARQYYYSDNLLSSLPLGDFGTRALPYETLTFAFTQNLLDASFDTKLAGVDLQGEGGYRLLDNLWWRPSGRVTFDPAQFYRVTEVRDPFGNLGTITYDAHALLATSTTDPRNNIVTASHDYRLLQPVLITDPNDNRQAIAFDALGMPIKTAVMGKVGDNDGDTLDDPTTELFYDLHAWENEQKPTYVHVKARERHGNANTPYQETYGYSGGMGQMVMQKVQAEPGLAPKRDQNGDLVFQNGELVFEDTSPDIRWVGTGRTILDNKGNPVKQYEPFFSSTPQYETEDELVEWGVSPLLHYDPLGRVIHTDLPNGTFSKVEFTPWEQTTHDPNDTVLDSDWYTTRQALTPGTDHNDAEIRASNEAAKHANTPSKALLDNLGRVFTTIEHNLDTNNQAEFYETQLTLDIEGNLLEVLDANKHIATTDTYAPGGLQLKTSSVDAGDRWQLPNVVGNPLRTYDSRGHARRWLYDPLNRPTHAFVRLGILERLYERSIYGEERDDPKATNHRGQLFRVYDSAGVLTADSYDFKGNPLSQTRRFAIDYTTTPDWILLAPDLTISALAILAAPLLEGETFTTSQTYDALNRVVTQTTPDASVTQNLFQEGGLLRRVRVYIKGSNTATVVVKNIDYNARGQRTLARHGNNARITYVYDPETFRVTRIRTRRQHNDPAQRRVQDLHYHYDPVGNIAEIRDNAQQGVYFQNAYIEPGQKFVYDAIYRLIEATGREHATLIQPTGNDFQPISHPQDVQQQQMYRQVYAYDPVGNITKMTHIANNGWTRGYAYAAAGNRLDKNSTVGDNPNDSNTFSHSYTYDPHGNMTSMPHLQAMTWDHLDRLQSTDHGGGGTTWFVYDGAGQRVRKVHVNQTLTSRKERLYFGAWETYRQYAKILLLTVLTDERETLHVLDRMSRMCLIETKVRENSLPVQAANVARYQYENHLGTASLELDGSGEIISYEEFHPYGTSSYRAANSAVDVSPKRYRYTGKERDEETGLGYHGARYYACWLGRWTAADPIGLGDGVNRFAYVQGNPLRLADFGGTAAKDVIHFEDEHVQGSIFASGTVEEGETKKEFASRVIQERFSGIETGERKQIEAELSDDAGIPDEVFIPGATGHFAVPPEKVNEFRKRFGATPRYQAKSGTRLAPELVEGAATGPVDPDVAEVAEIATIGLTAVEIGLTAIGVAALIRGGVKLFGEQALKKGAEKGLIREAEKTVVRSESRATSVLPSGERGSPKVKKVEDFLPEAKARLQRVKNDFPNVGDDFVGMARKSDLKQINRIVKDFSLNKEQRRLLHEEITGQDLSIEEIRSIAADIAKYTPKKGRNL